MCIYVQHARCKRTNFSESTFRMLGIHDINGDFLKCLQDSFTNDKQVSLEHKNWSDIFTSAPLHLMVICNIDIDVFAKPAFNIHSVY